MNFTPIITSTMKLDRKMKMAELVHLEPMLIHLLRRMNIRLGFGEKSVRDVCLEAGMNPDLFMAIAASFRDEEELPVRLFMQIPVGDLVSYIKENHKYYMEDLVPRMQDLIERLTVEYGGQDDKLNMVKEFLEQYSGHLTEHIAEEEDFVIPYVLEVEKCHANKKPTGEIITRIRNNPIRDFLESHTDIEEAIFELQNILIKYLPPPVKHKDGGGSQEAAFMMLPELFGMGRDVRIHSRIENLVMVPRVETMEKELMKMAAV